MIYDGRVGYRIAVAAVGFAMVGCFDPQAAGTAPCANDLSCPANLVCDQRRDPPACVDPSDVLQGCVPSECDPSQPVCDDTTGECRACVADSECDSQVCAESDGTCVPADEVLYAAPDGDDNNDCTTIDTPCLTVSGALGKLDSSRHTIRVAAGNYSESWVLVDLGRFSISGPGTDGDATVAFAMAGFGTGAHDHLLETSGTDLLVESLSLANTSGNEAVRVTSGNVVFDGVRIANSAGGLDIRAATVTLRRSAIVDNKLGSGIGVSVADGATLVIDRSTVDGNGIGIQMTAATTPIDYTITNTYITNNATRAVIAPAMIGATTRFEFNTVADNGGTPTMQCPTAVPVANSIFDAAIASSCQASFSLFGSTSPAGTSNLGNTDPGFTNNGYHLKGSSAAIDAADPSSTIDVDFDGDPRPLDDGYDIGADEHGG